ncbi:hypothetical protein CXB51_022340 [Gossypium anomalum]|uniref:Uncharacterized protein n=1 Tax=Gossypium anomalum TaxID=47600 RepID=A0A8J6CQ51_9ROSI|nr:hypothetical protein CXB51_022340 [Gossypium anomalum]
MEKTTHLKLCKLHPLVKYDKLNSGHWKTGVGLGRGNPKFGHRKSDVDHMLLICRGGEPDLVCTGRSKSFRETLLGFNHKVRLRDLLVGYFTYVSNSFVIT